jgi:hypothetical protein
VRERPELVGFNNFIIVDEREASLISTRQSNPGSGPTRKFSDYIKLMSTDSEFRRLARTDLPGLIKSIAISIIRWRRPTEDT